MATLIKFKNNAKSYLVVSLSIIGTSVTVKTGDGSKFPALGAGEFFYATLFFEDGTNEIVKVTARSTDTMTIVRAQESTTARAWQSTTTYIEMRATAGTLDYIAGVAATAEANAAAAVVTANAASVVAGDAQADAAAAKTTADEAVDNWIDQAETIVSSGSSTIVVSGNKTGTYTAGRPIRKNQSDSYIGRVVSSAYLYPDTTITISGFSALTTTHVEVGLLKSINALPGGTLPADVLVDTQALGDNSNLPASTEYADAAAADAATTIGASEALAAVVILAERSGANITQIPVLDVKTSGTAATLTWPTGATAVLAELQGGGGGGGGASGSQTAGGTTSVTYNGITYSAGGGAAGVPNQIFTVAGGTCTNCTSSVPGASSGGHGSGKDGGGSHLGFAGTYSSAARAPVGYGSGGYGADNGGSNYTGGAGGAFGIVRIVKVPGMDTITYTVGPGGAAGSGAAAGMAGRIVFIY